MAGMLPRYCCVILSCPERGFLLEQRPPTTRHAGGSVTCFGGGREPNESEDACARRELLEELGWTVGEIHRRAELRVRNEWIATFFVADAPGKGDTLRLERGYQAKWVPPSELLKIDLSSWHRAVLEAHLNEGPGVLRVSVDS